MFSLHADSHLDLCDVRTGDLVGELGALWLLPVVEEEEEEEEEVEKVEEDVEGRMGWLPQDLWNQTERVALWNL